MGSLSYLGTYLYTYVYLLGITFSCSLMLLGGGHNIINMIVRYVKIMDLSNYVEYFMYVGYFCKIERSVVNI